MPYRLSTALEERVGNRDKYGEDYQDLLRLLVAERKRLGVSQQELARSMGVDQSQVSKLERRERRLDLIDFIRYCRALNVAPGVWLDDALSSIAPPSKGMVGR